MKKSWLYGCSFILLSIFATACGDDEKDIYGIFYADIVTCHTNKGNPYFTYQTTDSAPVDTLYPVSEVNSDDMGEGVRVLLQYRPIETLSEHKKQVEIQALSAIHFDTLRIVPHDKIDQLPDDTLYLQSAWKTGDFLNLRYRIDYHSRPHSNDDPEGHWSNLYSSFNISAYRSRPYTTLQLYVNQVNFNYKYYYFKLN